MTMVEKVARILCVVDGKDPDADWRVGDGVMLSVAVEHPERWRLYEKKARAAIEAMREPTIEMRKVSSFEAAEQDWPAMIDAALADEKAEGTGASSKIDTK